MKVDYDKMYSGYTNEQDDYVQKTAKWKAQNLCKLIGHEPTGSILDVGTGRGEVLNFFHPFNLKIGADISEEALKIHKQKYINHQLVKIDADNKLPFKDSEVDFVLLCDILEHVDNPTALLKEAARVGKNVFVKIPVENAVLTSIMRKVYKIEYGLKHPSGHLHCWTLSGVENLIANAGLTIVRSNFIPISMETLRWKNFLHNSAVRMISMANYLTPNNFISRILLGGSFFAIIRK